MCVFLMTNGLPSLLTESFQIKGDFMNTVKGSIVKAVAGREKNGFFVVLDCDSVFAYIADGKRRKVEKPKKKKLIHISPTGTVIEGSIKTNPQIRKILNNFRKSEG